MLNNKKIIVVLPAYNAEKTLERTFNQIPKNIVDEVILVDDGSQDKTSQIVNQLGVDLVVHPINRGYGAAQRTGHEIAMMEGYDYILQLDADGQHDPKYIPILL